MAAAFLEGYRALDLTDLRGQLCGRLLADLGMEVIKIEPPEGDPVRRLGPFKESSTGALSLAFAHLNANKSSTTVDLKSASGREYLLRLAQQCDVVLESLRPGTMDRMGLGYRDLSSVNPGIVMVSLSCFGQSGPRRNFEATDIVALAMGGLLYVAGDPSLPPCKPPESQAYYFSSLFAALGVVGALYRRNRTGKGDWVDVAMQETLATQEHAIRLYANEGQIVKRQGSQHGQVAPARIFACRDGYVYLYVTRQHWKLFLEVWSDHPVELESPEWENNVFRRARVDYLNPLVEAFTRTRTKQELTSMFQERGVPCVPVNKPRDFTADEHVRERGFMVPVNYSQTGLVTQPAAPFMIDGSRPAVRAAPELGGWHLDEPDRAPSIRAALGGGESEPPGAPLDGMRVVSFDHVLAGPYGTTLLAELGAEVIKVESRRGGLDPFRFFGSGEDPNLSPRFFEFNRNKRSLTVNLKRPQGPEIIKDLVRQSDAVLDNFSVDVMAKLGLAYKDLCKVKPDIVVLRMPGLGSSGSKRHYATVGTNITSFTGLTYLWNHVGQTDPPVGSQTVYPDYVSGVFAAVLVVASILYRERHQRGVSIDLSQAEATAFMVGASLAGAETLGCDLQPAGNQSSWAAPHGCYPCKGEERWCVIAVETEEQWHALAGVIEQTIASDARFATRENRLLHQDELNGLIKGWTRKKDCYEVMESLQRVGVPCGVVQNGADLVADPHLRARGFIVEVEDSRLGRLILPGFPLRFTNSELKRKWEFPELGRDTRSVLRAVLNYSDETIADLEREGVLE
jgi:crotonobetainyl-CoA:carnitine CoA-transferase CaiB-like acyl-CoA transferase